MRRGALPIVGGEPAGGVVDEDTLRAVCRASLREARRFAVCILRIATHVDPATLAIYTDSDVIRAAARLRELSGADVPALLRDHLRDT